MRKAVVAAFVAGSVAGSLALSAPSAGAVALSPGTLYIHDCNVTPPAVPTLCVAEFSPTNAKAGATVSVTTDSTGIGGVYADFTFTKIRFSQGTSTLEVPFKTVAGDNRSGTFVMPVLPAGGTWDVDVNTSGSPQGAGQMTYDGAGDWVCATDWDQAIADSRTFCEQRFTKDGTLTVPADVTSLDFLVVGGGGGGGGHVVLRRRWCRRFGRCGGAEW